MIAHIDLSKSHGHRDDHGFACGAEFNVRTRRRINIPDFVRDQLSEREIDDIWWEEAGQARDSLRETLTRRYKWIGRLMFAGRGPGWLAIEDTGCRPRNWETIGKVIEQRLQSFIKVMESPSFWRDIKGIDPKAPTVHHATRKELQYSEGRYIVRAQNRGDTYRFANKASAKAFARTLAIETTKASVYDEKTSPHWPIASFMRDPSGRVFPIN